LLLHGSNGYANAHQYYVYTHIASIDILVAGYDCVSKKFSV